MVPDGFQVGEVARLLGVSVPLVRKWVRAGCILAKSGGGRGHAQLIPSSEVLVARRVVRLKRQHAVLPTVETFRRFRACVS